MAKKGAKVGDWTKLKSTATSARIRKNILNGRKDPKTGK